MLLRKERELVVDYGKRLITSGLTRGTGGNISIYCPEKKILAISPSGMDYFSIESEDVAVIDLSGVQLEGAGKPSSESEMHRIFYERRPDVRSVVHTHSVFCTTLATLKWSLPPANYLLAVAGGKISCAEYATYGTKELAENAFTAMADKKACLLANHGMLAIGNDIEAAFLVAETVEHCSEYYYRAKCVGEPVLLNKEQMAEMLEKIPSYGK